MDIVRDSSAGYIARRLFPTKFRCPEEVSTSLPSSTTPDTHANGTTKPFICDWNDDNDPDNPRNWPRAKKLLVVINVAACSFVVYGSAPIWTPSMDAYMEEYGTNHEYTSLGLSLYVLGYGLGPLLFSPLSEIPSIGRNIPYIATFLLYMLVSIPLALVRSSPWFMFLRFAQGFLGSPILATGGASLSDVYDETYLPFAISSWSGACFVAPAFAPIISSAALPALGWRFSMWEILIASGPVFALLLFWPETSAATILYWRAARLRKLTGNEGIRSPAETVQQGLTLKEIVAEALLIPARITVLDPAILFANVYMMLVYGIYYSFFESFPLVFGPMYGFGVFQSGLAFLPLAVGTIVALVAYTAYLYFYRLPRSAPGTEAAPEQVLLPGMAACFFPPIGLLIFGWTADPKVHWIVPMLGVAIYPFGVFVIFQSIFLYLPKSYPQYAASLFAAADATRSIFALAAIHFARPLFLALGIGGGCSLLAGLMVCCIFGLYALYYCGPSLRARSKFAKTS